MMLKSDKAFYSTKDWIKKLSCQANSSKSLRDRLYEMVDLKNKNQILDVGCGTGAITKEIALLSKGQITGIDTDKKKLNYAEDFLSECDNVRLLQMDVLNMPFDNESFDLIVFNLVLMHIPEQEKAVREMVRVTKSGGIVLASMEVDYAGSFEYPENSAYSLFLKAKEDRGIDIYTGRKLKNLFISVDLDVEVGFVNYNTSNDKNKIEEELERFSRNISKQEDILIKNGWDRDKIEDYKNERQKQIFEGTTFYFEPTFYAIGRK